MTSKKSERRGKRSAEKATVREIRTWITFRRISQLSLLILFGLLFLVSRYPIESSFTVDQFFKIDPLVFLLTSLASREWVTDLAWSIAFLAFALVLGRFFCGWICPLGSSIDISRRIIRKKKPGAMPSRRMMWFKYGVLFFLVAAALVSVSFFWFFDPLSVMLRSMTLFLYPIFANATQSLLELFAEFPALEDPALDTLDWMQRSLLPVYEQQFFMALFIALLFLFIILVERYSSRFWCRYLCPLGALFGLVSRKSLMQRQVDDDCTDCGICQRSCRMNAISAKDPRVTSGSECIFCLDCGIACPEGAISFGFARPQRKPVPVDLGRRRLVRAGFAGIVGAGIVGMNLIDREKASRAIRPPGALPEGDFSDRCIRCYACVRACSTSGGCLQPSLAEAGIESMLTPIAVMREGYCEFNCTLCGQVCPTGAIHELPLEEKKTRKMGLALINHSRCIPWESGEDCIVCEEHCPVPDKAILFDSREVQVAGKGLKTVKLPYVLRDRCIGCGICETKCPVTGEAAIVVSRETEERWLGV